MTNERTEEPDWKVGNGDAKVVLDRCRSGFVHCAVTSPPYWGLRDYGQEGQLGLEPTPELYVEHLVDICRSVRRVLRDDGTFWLNLGDSYAQARGHGHWTPQGAKGDEQGQRVRKAWAKKGAEDIGLKPKDLVGIPWRVAFALQQDGWWLRNAIVWQKPNPMPSSVRDRLTTCYEFIFLFAKSREYYYDADAIKEQCVKSTSGNIKRKLADGTQRSRLDTHMGSSIPWNDTGRGRNKRDVWTVATKPCSWEFCLGCGTPYEGKERRQISKKGKVKTCPGCGSTDRWVEHFAMFPADLIEPCILAGTSEAGCCPDCGKPWQRVTERVDKGYDGSTYGKNAVKATGGAITGGTAKSTLGSSHGTLTGEMKTIGWESSCSCGAEGDEPLPDPIPCTVLDPFCGAGTTGIVSVQNGRRFVGVDLKPDYVKVSEARIERASCQT